MTLMTNVWDGPSLRRESVAVKPPACAGFRKNPQIPQILGRATTPPHCGAPAALPSARLPAQHGTIGKIISRMEAVQNVIQGRYGLHAVLTKHAWVGHSHCFHLWNSLPDRSRSIKVVRRSSPTGYPQKGGVFS